MVRFIVWLRHGMYDDLSQEEVDKNRFGSHLSDAGAAQVRTTAYVLKDMLSAELPARSTVEYLSSHATRALESFAIVAHAFGQSPRSAKLTVSSSLFYADDKFNIDVENLLSKCAADVVIVTAHKEWCEQWSTRLPQTIGELKLPAAPDPKSSNAIKVKVGAAVVLDLKNSTVQLVS